MFLPASGRRIAGSRRHRMTSETRPSTAGRDRPARSNAEMDGPLTVAERELVESHPELGEKIIGPIDRLEDVRPIVRHCHERFDGAGYPDRLSGEDIPIESRIILVCDAYHAMTTDRPYRMRLSITEAVRRLDDGSGTQFDPRVVDACKRVLEERESS